MFRHLLQLRSLVHHKPVLRLSSTNQEKGTWRKTKMSGGDSLKVKIRENPVITKLDSPQFHAIFSPELRVIIETFKKYGFEIRLAGGPVRFVIPKSETGTSLSHFLFNPQGSVAGQGTGRYRHSDNSNTNSNEGDVQQRGHTYDQHKWREARNNHAQGA